MTTRHYVHVRREPFYGERFDFLLGGRISDRLIRRAKPIEFEKIAEDQTQIYEPPQPTFSLESSDGQYLMDELWRAGLRPTEVGTAGHLAATQKHLEDMRQLVFHAQRIPKP